MPWYPEAELYRCKTCTHAFSVPSSIAVPETYGPDYYDEQHRRWFEHPNLELFRAVLHFLPQRASVLDVGCGRGDFLRFVRRSRPDLRLAGIDLSENQNVDGITFSTGQILTWKTDERFDAIVSLAVIEHVDDVHSFVARLRELTRAHAMVVTMTLNDSSLLYALARSGRAVGARIAFDRLYSKHHVHHFTPQSLRMAFQLEGFSVHTQFSHAAPIEAMDIPVSNPLIEFVLRQGLRAVWSLGGILRRGYLQTIICEVQSGAKSTPEHLATNLSTALQ
jgi:2-polyprenyl-3-methyl-5-hydroxy-6-metoxy-1,4-benzoquinol methylase